MTPFSSIRFGADTSVGSKPLDLSKIPIYADGEHGPDSVSPGSIFGVSFPYKGMASSYGSASVKNGQPNGFQYKNMTARDGNTIYLFRAPDQSSDVSLDFYVRHSESGQLNEKQTVNVAVR